MRNSNTSGIKRNNSCVDALQDIVNNLVYVNNIL